MVTNSWLPISSNAKLFNVSLQIDADLAVKAPPAAPPPGRLVKSYN
jgi:hypothetical protein